MDSILEVTKLSENIPQEKSSHETATSVFLGFLLSTAFASIGLLFLYVYLHIIYTTPLRGELLVVSDVPAKWQISTVKGRFHSTFDFAHFSLEGQKIVYSDEKPNFHLLVEALINGDEISAKISKKPEGIFFEKSSANLFELSVGDQSIITYDESTKGNQAVLIGAIVLLCLGTFGFWVTLRGWKRLKHLSNAC